MNLTQTQTVSSYIDYSDEELVQSYEEIDVVGLSPLGDNISQVDSAAPAITRTSILSFSEEVARLFLSNFSQENCSTLVEQICANYGYSIFTADIHGCLRDEFFQEYALRNKYLLTPAFLAQINQLKNEFSHKIDSVIDVEDFRKFLFKIYRRNSKLLETLINSYSADFSRSSHHARHNLVEVLTSTVIPKLVKTINQHTVIRGSDECLLDYTDREKFFLHVVTTFERLIILKLMNYWNAFCSINRDILSSLPNIDFSNPFILAKYSYFGIIPEVNCPVAFNFRYGICISFMANDHFDKIVSDTASTCIRKLGPVVLEIVKKNYSGICHLKDLSIIKEKTISGIINDEFSKVLNECIRNKFIDFLNKSLIWTQEPLSQDVLQNFVRQSIDMISRLVKEKITSKALGLIKKYKDNIRGMIKNKRIAAMKSGYNRMSFKGRYGLSDICGFKLSEDFFSTLDDIRSRSFEPFRLIATGVIFDTLKSGKLTKFDWASVSKKLISDIINASKIKIDIVYREMSNAILKARVISEEGIERDILPAERAILHKYVMQLSNERFRHNIPRLWKDMVKKYLESGASSSETSAVPSSRDESTQPSSSLAIVEDKSNGKKRKIDVATSEDRPNIVCSEYGLILVRREFNDEINLMISGHLDYVYKVFEDIRGNLEERNFCATDDELVENMRRQSSKASENILSEFIGRVRALVSKTSVYGNDMKERVIHKKEVSSFIAQLSRVITIRHDEILDKKLEELIINVVD